MFFVAFLYSHFLISERKLSWIKQFFFLTVGLNKLQRPNKTTVAEQHFFAWLHITNLHSVNNTCNLNLLLKVLYLHTMKRYTLRRFDKLTGLNFKAAPWTDRFLDIQLRFFPVEFASTSICPKEAKSYDNALGTGPAEQFLKCGAGNHLFWSGAGEGEGQIWLFSLCVCLELSDYWTFLESLLSWVIFINFQPLKSTFLLLSLIAHAGSTSTSLQIMILHCGFLDPFLLSSMSSKCVRDFIISRYNSF